MGDLETEGYTYQPLDLDAIGPVDWRRMAHPQDDQYDTEVFERIAALRYGWKRNELPASTPTWLDGRVEIRKADPPPWGNTNLVECRPDNERWAWAAELAASWPAQYEQFRRLINYVGADYDNGKPANATNGCSSSAPGGNPYLMNVPIGPERWGCTLVTMLSGSGFCEGVTHELGHWRGYALGIFIEDWEHLIFANEPPKTEWMKDAPARDSIPLGGKDHRLWVSRGLGFQPFRPDKLRPIGALFQEIWICIHMIEYHLRMVPLLEGGFPGEPPFKTFLGWADYHIVRTVKGHRDMLAIAKPTPDIGEAFWDGYCSWVDRLLVQANDVYGKDYHV